MLPTFEIDRAAIAQAVQALSTGGLVAMPTETVYGLAADADSEVAVRAVFAAKDRPADHPVIVHIADANAVHAWAREVPQSARLLAAAFWPGPLTMVLPRSARARDVVTGGQDSVGLRCPSHPWAQALLQAWIKMRNDPAAALAAPSANRYGAVSATTAAHVRADLGLRPQGILDFVLDAGPSPVGIESTIVDLSGGEGSVPSLLRPGSIHRAQLEAILQTSVPDAGATAPRASGRVEKHYAPRTPVERVPPEQLMARIDALSDRPVAVLAPHGALREPVPAHVRLWLNAESDPDIFGSHFYAHLHRLDAVNAARILIAEPPSGARWEAVADRLRRACA